MRAVSQHDLDAMRRAVDEELAAIRDDMRELETAVRAPRPSCWQRLKQRDWSKLLGVCVALLAVAVVVAPILAWLLGDEPWPTNLKALFHGLTGAFVIVVAWRFFVLARARDAQAAPVASVSTHGPPRAVPVTARGVSGGAPAAVAGCADA